MITLPQSGRVIGIKIILMKMISTYISLLLLCGFMLLFYYTRTYPNNKAGKMPGGQKIPDTGQKVFYKPANDSSFIKKIKAMETTTQQTGFNEKSFSFFNDIIGDISPVLKNLEY